MQGESDISVSIRDSESVGGLNGDDLRDAFVLATRCLENHRDAVNALNVFPVPDGDTGTNMLLTMRSVNEAAEECGETSAEAVSAAMAHGALLNSRGNSGVILSQFFHGLAQGLRSKEVFDGLDLVWAFEAASRAANSAVSKPVAGTMLTVISEASLAVSRHVGDRGGSRDVLTVWQVALEAAKIALCRTPLQLQVLRDAGVVDAGGQGVVILLEGAYRHLAKEPVDDQQSWLCIPVLDGDSAPSADDPFAPSVREEYLHAIEGDQYGYCTQFLLTGEAIDVDQFRDRLAALADSTVVVGTDTLARVHLHTHDLGPIISLAVTLGTISQVSMDNMDQQHGEFVSLHKNQAAKKQPAEKAAAQIPLAVVAVASGDGFVKLFEELGCAGVVLGGQTMNPSTGELLQAARNTGAQQVVLLPNNSNIVPAARQAATIAEGNPMVSVLPARTIPQGLAALLCFNPEGGVDPNLEAMAKALGEVRTLEITRAVRDATLGGVAVLEGQFMGLLEGSLVSTADSAMAALCQAISSTMAKEDPVSPELVTLYWGDNTSEEQASLAAEELGRAHPKLDIQVVYGGQPHYPYIASLE